MEARKCVVSGDRMATDRHIKKSCAYCSKITIYARPSAVRTYCSYKCSNKHKWEKRPRPEKISFICEGCQTVFFVSASAARERTKRNQPPRFCSRKCSALDKTNPETKKVVLCSFCSAPFAKRHDLLGKRNFCSRTCVVEARKKSGPWSLSNRDNEALRLYNRQYRQKNRERLNKLAANWAKQNRPYRNFLQQKRRAAGSLTYEEWKELIENAKECANCGSAHNLQVDHIIPIAKGGRTDASNLQVLCSPCNSSKGARPAPLIKRATNDDS